MIRASVEFPRGVFEGFTDKQVERLKRAMLNVTHTASMAAKDEIRSAMESSGLGTLGNAIGQYSDKKKGVFYRGGGSFSASGVVYVRSSSARSRGAIESYTEGADITPTGKNGPWLWFATNQIPKRAGRFRMTPALYNKTGLDRRIGPLVKVKRPNGYPLLIVNTIGFNVAGRARSLNRSGGFRKGQVAQGSIVAFIGIPFTARTSRVDINAIVRKHADTVSGLFATELQKGL